MKAEAAFSQLGRRTTEPPISWLMKMTLDRPQLISLAAGFTDDVSLPVGTTGGLVKSILSDRSLARRSLQYGATGGDPKLRRMTAERLRCLDGAAEDDPVYSADRLLITHGSQQLLYLLTEALCDPGDIVLVEDPTYFVYLGILQSHGVGCRGIRMTERGLDVAHLERVLEELKSAGSLARVKMLYLVSYFQNPSGITTSYQAKADALRVLRKFERLAGHPIYLLEDAAYRELRFAGDPVPSALAIEGAAERVLYAGTFSKPFATGIRVGYGMLPKPLLDLVLRVKGNHDFGTAHFLQQILVRALETKTYDAHLEKLCRRYRRKATAMMKAIREHFPAEVKWREPRGGLYVWAQLPRSVRTGTGSRMFQRALARDVLYVPGELCYGSDASRRPDRSAMRLSFGGASEEEIWRGIARLGEVLRKLKKK